MTLSFLLLACAVGLLIWCAMNLEKRITALERSREKRMGMLSKGEKSTLANEEGKK
jgi:hypothetical protein